MASLSFSVCLSLSPRLVGNRSSRCKLVISQLFLRLRSPTSPPSSVSNSSPRFSFSPPPPLCPLPGPPDSLCQAQIVFRECATFQDIVGRVQRSGRSIARERLDLLAYVAHFPPFSSGVVSSVDKKEKKGKVMYIYYVYSL